MASDSIDLARTLARYPTDGFILLIGVLR